MPWQYATAAIQDNSAALAAKRADLTISLSFDSAFTRELIQLGYRDTAQRVDEIEKFLLAPHETPNKARSP